MSSKGYPRKYKVLFLVRADFGPDLKPEASLDAFLCIESNLIKKALAKLKLGASLSQEEQSVAAAIESMSLRMRHQANLHAFLIEVDWPIKRDELDLIVKSAAKTGNLRKLFGKEFFL